MSFFEKMRKDAVLAATAYLILGAVLLFFPGIAVVTMVHILAIAAAVIGVITIILYFAKGDKSAGSGGLIKGIVYLAAAAALYFAAPLIVSVIPFVLGILIVISGVVKLQEAMDLMKHKQKSWGLLLVFAIPSIVLGILAIVNPFKAAELLLRIIGISLIYSAVSDLLTVFYFSKKTKY